MFELFELSIDQVEFPLDNPDLFNPDSNKLRIMKEITPIKDISSIIRDKKNTSVHATSFMDILS